MKRLAAIVAGAALLATTSSAMATVVNMNGGEKNLQTILNEITVSPVPGKSSVNAAKDFIKDPNDSLWRTNAVGISSATMVVELAGRAGTNSFGIYDSKNLSNTAQLFAGAATSGSKITLTFGDYSEYGNYNLLVQEMKPFGTSALFNFDSTTFGFYLNSDGKTYYSDTSKNADSFDHMVAFASPGNDVLHLQGNPGQGLWGGNEYILAFEDSDGGGDSDYNDMVLMVESVSPVPEPGTMMLLGAGFLGLAIYGKRRRNA